MRFLSTLLAVILVSSFASAEEPEDNIVSIKKGQTAPFDGQLFDTPTAIRWGIYMQQVEQRSQITLETQKQLCNIELKYQSEVGSIDQKKMDLINSDLESRLKRSEEQRAQAEHALNNPVWYESTWFGVAAGALGTIGIVVAGVVVAK